MSAKAAEKKILHKARKLSKVFSVANAIEGGPFLSPSTEAVLNASASGSGASGRPDSISGASAVTSSTETSSQLTVPSSVNANSTEQLRRKASRLSRQSAENIPPPSQRQSLDLVAQKTGQPSLRRSRSLWARQQQEQEGSNEVVNEFQDRYMRNFGTMSERQRALSVKRARKMTQVFGQEPPAELIQVQDDREEEDPSRDSMAFSALFASTPTLRDRAGSVSSLGDASADELPATPPPFSTSFARGEEGETRDTNNFQDRRRRAAKLSRFFGVDVTAGLPDAMPALPTAKMQVDVKVSGRRFWGFNDRPKDSDMQEAMKKLREMKAG